MSRPEFIAVALSAVSAVLIANVDIVFVKKFMSPVEAGIYSSWTVCSRILYYVMGPLISVGFLFFSNTKDKKEQKNTLFLSLFILILASVGYFFLFDQQGTFVIHLMFGQKFNSMIPYLHQAALYGVGYLFMQFFATYFLAQKGKMAYVFPAGLIFYIISLFLFGHTLASIMMVNIAFSFTIVGVYLASFLFSSA